ncbi:MAG TPA: EAL domain-containing protein [Anaerolineaceae bacterium]|nr:EAL domain-containing protein [Anaerolineaceae bacterium]HPN52970.1 EAL domain-containing protein [Anaerolineaceae bacterium]
MMKNYSDIEEEVVIKNLGIVSSTLDNEIVEIQRITGDWGPWDPTYQFIQDLNQEYIDSNLVKETFINLRLNWVMFVLGGKKIVYEQGFDRVRLIPQDVPLSFKEFILDHPALLTHVNSQDAHSGFITLDNRLLLLSIWPITTSNFEAPIIGSIIFVREIDEEELSALENTLHTDFKILSYNAPLPDDFSTAKAALASKPAYIMPLGQYTMAGYMLIKDVLGNPASIIRVNQSRDIYNQGRASINFFTWAIIISSLGLLTISMLAMESSVLSRLYRLGQQVVNIARVKNPGLRVSLAGNDELALLTQNINEMLNALEKAGITLKEKENQLLLTQFSFDNASDSLFWVNTQGKFIYANKAAQEMTGYSLEELQQLSVFDLNPQFNQGGWNRFVVWLGKRRSVTVESHILTRSGINIPVETTGNYLEYNGTLYIFASVRDISDKKRSRQALKESQERYALALNGSNDGIWDWDLRANQVYYSDRMLNILGGSQPGQNAEHLWMDRVHPDDRRHFTEALQMHLSGKTSHFENEHRITSSDGKSHWVQVRGLALRDHTGQVYRMSGSLSDISARKEIEQQLRHDAMHDVLTGLPNRLYFTEQIRRVLEHIHRHPEQQSSILLLDLDQFKLVNDSLGHAAGDELLRQVSKRLVSCVRPDDTIARFSGDEFAILLEGIPDHRDAFRIASRIHEAFSQPFIIDDCPIFSSASIGIVLITDQYTGYEGVIRDADIAMYQAKASGRGAIQNFDSQMHDASLRQFQLESDLRRAIENKEFELYYQPIVSAATGKIISAEALIRWNHPRQGLISPGEFIPLAESSGLILPIGEWVMDAACRFSAQMNQNWATPIPVSINVSANQLIDDSFIETLKRTLLRYNINPACLYIEITESAAMFNLEKTVDILKEVSQMGIHIAIDDFGSNYASLAYLKQFPAHILKIDRSFIQDININDHDFAITAAVIAMAHIIGLKVIAEGIENLDQLNHLRIQQCDSIQGYFASRPLPEEQFLKLLMAGDPLLPPIHERPTQAVID